jgi:hypothetical protein
MDPSIAEIDSQGTITAHKKGVTYIHAVRQDKTLAVAKVMVYEKEELVINVDREKVELEEDNSLTLNVTSNKDNALFTYQVEDTNIAKWNKDGSITGIKNGNTTLTIQATYMVAEGLVLTAEKKVPITVLKKEIGVTDISLEKTEYELNVADQITIPVQVLPNDATNKQLTWKSDNESIISVDGNGKVLAVDAGETVVTVTAHNGVHKDIHFVVRAVVPKRFKVDKTHIEINQHPKCVKRVSNIVIVKPPKYVAVCYD